MIKTFSTAVLLSTATGLALPSVPFAKLHEAIEHLLGEPVWTHQLASPEPWDRAREALISQHPAFANIDGDTLTSACGNLPDDARNSVARAWTDNQTSLLGATEFAIVRGAGRSPDIAQHDAMVELLALDKPVLVVGVDAGVACQHCRDTKTIPNDGLNTDEFGHVTYIDCYHCGGGAS